MLSRRGFLGAVSVGPLIAPRSVRAQPARKIPLVACLWASAAAQVQPYRVEFEAGLQDRGWVAGRNIHLEHRYPDSTEAVDRLAKELVRLKPDVILAVTNPVIDVVRRITTSIPIVMLYVATPVEAGFIKTLGRPGTNLTGLSFDPSPELYAKDVEVLKEVAPRASRIGVLWNPQFYEISPAMRQYLDAVRAAGQRLALTLRFFPVTRLADVEILFSRIDDEHLDGMFVTSDPFVTFQHHRRIAELTAKRFPAVFVSREHVDAGGLLSYGPSLIRMPRYVAVYVDKLLRGARAADLPVEQPNVFELVVNLKTAKALGLTVPRSLLLRADHIIE
jgi:ABC-type uncharacterized transport system substrate-binding protein